MIGQPNYQVFVVRTQFSAGDVSRSALKVGEVLEVDVERRMVRYQGKEMVVRTINSAITLKWLTPPRPDEMQFIRKHGVSPDRQRTSHTPDFQAISSERAQVMRETIPEDLRAETAGYEEEQVQSMRLQDVQTTDQYAMEGAAHTQRIAGQIDQPQDPVSQVIDGQVPSRPVRMGKSQMQAPDPQQTDEPGELPPPPDPSKLQAWAEQQPLDAVDEGADGELADYEGLPSSPEELAALTVAEYHGDFDYKKALSNERKKQLEEMPLDELRQLAAFLQYRDQADGKSRKITEQVADILKGREAAEQRGTVGNDRRAAAKPAVARPQLSFAYDLNKPVEAVLHDAQMRLSVEQVQELAEAFAEMGQKAPAKALADVARQRQLRGPRQPETTNTALGGAPALLPNEMALVAKINGGLMPQSSPAVQPPAKKGAVGAMLVSDDQDIFSAASPEPPGVPTLQQSRQAIDVSPTQLPANTSEAVDIGNQSAPRETLPFIGSEEGVTQQMNISGRTQQALDGQPQAKDPNVVDISHTLESRQF